MELPSRREQKRDFREWKRELRESEVFDDEEYIAPSRITRFARAFRYWFVSYEERQGPALEYFETTDPGHFGSPFWDNRDNDDGGWTGRTAD